MTHNSKKAKPIIRHELATHRRSITVEFTGYEERYSIQVRDQDGTLLVSELSGLRGIEEVFNALGLFMREPGRAAPNEFREQGLSWAPQPL